MQILSTILLGVMMISAVVMIGLILIQHGKGADMGAAFGSGASGSLFGASGSANFLSRTTAVLAAVFFATSLGLTYFSAAPHKTGGVTQSIEAPAAPKADAKPAAPASSAPAPAVPVETKPGEIPK